MKHVIMAAVVLASATAAVQAQDSVYTPLDKERCQILLEETEAPGAYTESRCTGHGGWSLFLRSGEHGESSAYSQGSAIPKDFEYGGYVGNFGNYHDVVEWRLDSDGVPFATIHRYHSAVVVENGDMAPTSVLIVTGLRPGGERESCHIGYILASEVADANVQARRMADEIAPLIDCEDHQPFRIDTSVPDVHQLMSLHPRLGKSSGQDEDRS
ncbi:hypothetical protein WM2015_1164 [Wenzhouxiangella marina]|uniref:Secreted protein n=2 Tax=Wenzhouxiangella marina TaxID=1579979 RepID=A0A0K0XV32_9GAMM|nr:hypothetical protein WM2015_1164 [Wenzhouxiangella marina]